MLGKWDSGGLTESVLDCRVSPSTPTMKQAWDAGVVVAKRLRIEINVWKRFMLAEVDRGLGINLLCFKQIGFEAKEIMGDSIEVEQIVELCLSAFDIFAFSPAPFSVKLRGT